MKLYKSSGRKKLRFQLNANTTEIAVNKVHWDIHYPYCDEELEAIRGPEEVDLAECFDIDQFMTEINKSKFLHVSLVDGKFNVQDTSGILGEEPLGIYSVPNEEKRLVLVKNGTEYGLQDYPEYDFANSSKVLFFRGGSPVDYIGDIRLSGTWTSSRFAETNSLLLGADTSTPDNRYHSAKTRGELANIDRGLLQNDVCYLAPEGRLSYPPLLEGDSIVLSVVGKNNGILLQSPFIGFVDPLHLKKKEDILKTCACGVVLRAFKVFENVGMELVADIPVDTKALRFLKKGNGKVQIKAIKKDDTEVTCFKTPVLSATSQFVIADNQRTVESFEVPTLFQKTVLTNRNGCLVASFRTPNSASFGIVVSPKFEIYVTNGVLFVNAISTGLACTANKNYIMTVERTADLVVDLLEVGGSVVSFSQTGSSFGGSVAQDADFTWQAGIEIGPWAASSEVTDVDKILQVIRAETEGSPNSSNLGSYAAGVFGSFGATYADGVLSKGGVNYIRQPLLLSEQLQNVLRLNTEEVQGTTYSARKAYIERVAGLNIYGAGAHIVGYNGSNLLAICNQNDEVQNEHFHSISGHFVDLTYEIVDAQTKLPRSVVSHHKGEKWAVTCSVR